MPHDRLARTRHLQCHRWLHVPEQGHRPRDQARDRGRRLTSKGTPRVPVGGSATRDLTTHAKCRLLGQPRRILPDPRTARCAY